MGDEKKGLEPDQLICANCPHLPSDHDKDGSCWGEGEDADGDPVCSCPEAKPKLNR